MIARRVGSASAENTALSRSVPDTKASSRLTNLLNVVRSEPLVNWCVRRADQSRGWLTTPKPCGRQVGALGELVWLERSAHDLNLQEPGEAGLHGAGHADQGGEGGRLG
jgi:hypothetical protein